MTLQYVVEGFELWTFWIIFLRSKVPLLNSEYIHVFDLLTL